MERERVYWDKKKQEQKDAGNEKKELAASGLRALNLTLSARRGTSDYHPNSNPNSDPDPDPSHDPDPDFNARPRHSSIALVDSNSALHTAR
jgi:hypothetical protein